MTREAYPAYAYKVIRVQRQASLGRQNFGPRRNFRLYFCDFFEVAQSFWPETFLIFSIDIKSVL